MDNAESKYMVAGENLMTSFQLLDSQVLKLLMKQALFLYVVNK